MKNSIETSFTVSAWDETSVEEWGEGGKISRAKVKQEYSGAWEGHSHIEYTMLYTSASSASFVGFEIFDGKVDAKQGRFVIQHIGRFESGVAKSQFQIVENSGTDELIGISGQGVYETTGHAQANVSLKYEIQ